MENNHKTSQSPKMIKQTEGTNYAWCSCGKSSNQPWCNGAHADTDKLPTVFVAENNKTVAICMCKQTNNPPYCDGSHNKLS